MQASFTKLLAFIGAAYCVTHDTGPWGMHLEALSSKTYTESRWTPWTPCSVSCGKGVSIRYERCNFLNNVSTEMRRETKQCFEQFCPSYLSWPRIHFTGTLVSDASTVNNHACNYDITTFDQSSRGGANPDGSGHVYLSNGNITKVCEKPGRCNPYHEITTATINQHVTAVIVDVDPDWTIATEIWGMKLSIPDHLVGEMLPASMSRQSSRIEFDYTDSDMVGVYKSKLKIIQWKSIATQKMFKNAKFLSISFTLDLYSKKTLSCRLVGTIGLTSDDDPLQTMVTRSMRGVQHSYKHVCYAPFFLHRDRKVLTIDLSASMLHDRKKIFRSVYPIDLAVWLPTRVFCKFFWSFKHCMRHEQFETVVIHPITHGGWISKYLDNGEDWYTYNAGVVDIDLSHIPEEIIDLMVRHRLGIIRNINCRNLGVIWAEDSMGIQIGQAEKVAHKLNPGEEHTVTVVVSAFGKPAPNVYVVLDSFIKQINASCKAKCDRTLGKPGEALLISGTTPFTDSYGKVEFRVEARHGPRRPRGCSLIGQLYPLRITARYNDGRKSFLYEEGSTDNDQQDNKIHLNSYYSVTQLFDDEPDITCPTWMDIKHIFHQYYNLYPVMWKNGIIDMHSYEDMKRKARSLKAAMFEFNISDARYMPVQRDLSLGKRRLIWNWMKCGMKFSNGTNQEYPDICTNLEDRMENLRGDVEDVAVLEFATIPPYFTAWLSIKSEEGRNVAVSNIVKSVMEDEMRHFAMAMNLVNAIRGSVTIFKNHPSYPLALSKGHMYGFLKGENIPIAKISKGLLNDVFSRIEQPLTDGGKQLVETIATLWHTLHPKRQQDTDETLHPSMKKLLKDFDSIRVYEERIHKKRSIPPVNSWRKILDFASKELGKLQHIHTVGGFYTKIALETAALEACAKLGKMNHSTIFTGNSSYQLNSSHWYSPQDESIECMVQEVANSMGDFRDARSQHAGRRPRSVRDTQRQSCTVPSHTTTKTIASIWDLKSALQAIVEIIYEGEGSSLCSPLVESYGTNSDLLAHYYRFQEIIHGRRLVKVWNNQVSPSHICLNTSKWCQESLKGWSFCYSGEKIHFFEDGVWDILTNPTGYTPGTTTFNLNSRFNNVYHLLLSCLKQTFQGEPDFIKHCMAYMHDMTVIGKQMVSSEINKDSKDLYCTTNKHATPIFD